MSEVNPFIISQEELAGNLAAYKIIDASWYLPAHERNGRDEYDAWRIAGAVFFDIEAISDTSSSLPHMLPSPEIFAKAVGELGISENDDIVVYDGLGLFSSARCWWSLRTMGAKSVRILEGGFDRWKAADLPVETGAPSKPKTVQFTSNFDSPKVSHLDDVFARIKDSNCSILDARPYDRWLGQAKEPRAGMRSGHIPGSYSFASSGLVKDGALLSIEELKAKFSAHKITPQTQVLTTCGSGVTAAIISLALSSVGHENQSLYDGSWAEWGSRDDTPVVGWQ